MKHSVLIVAGALLALSSTGSAEQRSPSQNVSGTWDLFWQTRKGPSKRGYMVVTQSGSALVAQIHGQGSVKARGTLAGTTFKLQGSRLAVPYIIIGIVEGERMTGSLKVLSVERHFTGARRPR
jgi:hypothetical protein